jgi:hypothetical protein
MDNIKTFNKFFENNLEDDSKTGKTIKTTSLKHYKKLRDQGIDCELVTKYDINLKD